MTRQQWTTIDNNGQQRTTIDNNGQQWTTMDWTTISDAVFMYHITYYRSNIRPLATVAADIQPMETTSDQWRLWQLTFDQWLQHPTTGDGGS